MNKEKQVLPTEPKYKVGDKIETKRGYKLTVLEVGPKDKGVFMAGKPFQYLAEQGDSNCWFPESLIK